MGWRDLEKGEEPSKKDNQIMPSLVGTRLRCQPPLKVILPVQGRMDVGRSVGSSHQEHCSLGLWKHIPSLTVSFREEEKHIPCEITIAVHSERQDGWDPSPCFLV